MRSIIERLKERSARRAARSRAARRATRLLFLTFLLLALTLLPALASQRESQSPRHVVVVSIDHATFQEMVANPQLGKILNGYAGALVAARTGAPIRSYERSNAYATIAVGDKAFLDPEVARHVFVATELVPQAGFSARDVFYQRTGVRPRGSLVAIAIPAIERALSEQELMTTRTIGDALDEARVETWFFGNADDAETLDRAAAIAVMKSSGEIKNGDCSLQLAESDPSFTGGLVTDFDELRRRVTEALQAHRKENAVMWVDTGDTARLERRRDELTDERYRELKDEALSRAARFIESIQAHLDPERDLLIVLSAAPPADRAAEDSNLTAVFVRGRNFPPGSYLYSPATRTRGLVTLTDISKTILASFDIEDPAIAPGGGALVASGGFAAERTRMLAALDEKLSNVSSSRSSVLTTFVVILIVAIIGAGAYAFFGGAASHTPTIRPVLCSLAAYPVAALVTSPLYAFGEWWAPVASLLISVLFGVVARKTQGPGWRCFATIGGLSAALVILDALAGAPLGKFSPLGYSPVIGARFYGIGNEYMGVVVGGTLLLWAFLNEPRPGCKPHSLLVDLSRSAGRMRRAGPTAHSRRAEPASSRARTTVATILILMAAVALGIPTVGANVGGALAAAVAFSAAWAYSRRGVRVRGVLFIAGALIVTIALLVASSFVFPSFHLAGAVRRALAGDWNAVASIAWRKIAVNLKLLRYTIWSDVLLVMVVVFPALMLHPPGVLAAALRRSKPYDAAVAGAAIGAVAALLFNDSGVVAAATLLLAPALALLDAYIDSMRQRA
jgi:hypothetical protein